MMLAVVLGVAVLSPMPQQLQSRKVLNMFLVAGINTAQLQPTEPAKATATDSFTFLDMHTLVENPCYGDQKSSTRCILQSQEESTW